MPLLLIFHQNDITIDNFDLQHGPCNKINTSYFCSLKVACQGEESDADPDTEEDKDLSEYDGMLIEMAADILPKMCKAIGGENFKPYFAGMLPELMKRLVSIIGE